MTSSISIVIAIFNRKDELFELLNSLVQQEDKVFEVVVVDDGSSVNLQSTIDIFLDQLTLKYYKKNNSGPGLSRNFGSKHASGNFLIFLDSDVVVAKDYIKNIKQEIQLNPCDAFGGADKAHKGFNIMQKAISYAMTSVFTTGGIRGNIKSVSKFQPRSFNMGVKKEVFETLGGFSDMRVGEDPDLSLSLWEKGFTTCFYNSIAVYHKRRTDLGRFSVQVYQFGCARPILNQRHPKYVKISYAFPTLFLLGYVLGIVDYILFKRSLILFGYGFYSILLFFHALFTTKNISIASMGIMASYIQLFSYGYGFMEAWIKLNLIRMRPQDAFPNHFYQKK